MCVPPLGPAVMPGAVPTTLTLLLAYATLIVTWSYTRREAKHVNDAQKGILPSRARPAPMPIMLASHTPALTKLSGWVSATRGLVPEALLRSASRQRTFGFSSINSQSVSP